MAEGGDRIVENHGSEAQATAAGDVARTSDRAPALGRRRALGAGAALAGAGWAMGLYGGHSQGTAWAAAPADRSATPGAGSASRSGPVYDVRAFGAAGNGTQDDSAAIQSAIAAANAAGGGVVFLPVGTYTIGTTIHVLQNVDLLGENRASTVLQTLYSGINAIELRGVSFSRLANLQVRTGVILPASAGAAVYLDHAFTTSIDAIYIDGKGNGYDGIVVHESTATFIRGFNIYNLLHDGVRVEGPQGNDAYLSDGIMNLGQTTGGAAVHLLNFPNGAFNLTDADILTGRYGLLVDGANYLRFENTYFDSSAQGALLRRGHLITFSNCWFSNRPGPGLTIGGARGVTVLGGQATNCGGHGVRVTDGALGVSLVGVQVVGNNTAGTGADGIRIEGGAAYVAVSHCIVGNDPAIFPTPGQEVGIHVTADAGGDCVLTGNLLFGNLRAAVLDERPQSSYTAGNLSRVPTSPTPAAAVHGPNLTAGISPAIAMNSPDSQAVTLTQEGHGTSAYYRAQFTAQAASLPGVSAEGDWIAFLLPQLTRGDTYLFEARVWGNGICYLDVWDGTIDHASLTATLGAQPQVLSLTVRLPRTGLSPGNSTPQIQVRTHNFPCDVRFTVSVHGPLAATSAAAQAAAQG